MALAASTALFTRVAAEEIANRPVVPATGLRHEILASFGLDPSSPYLHATAGTLRADVHVSIRISDHAPDSDFFGVVTANFSDVNPLAAPTEQKIWEDGKCH